MVGMLGGCFIFGGGIIECDEDLGVCPKPEVGVLVDDGRFAKSVWAEAGAMVRPVFQTTGEVQATRCLGDVDRAEGDEVILKGERGCVGCGGEPAAAARLGEGWVRIDRYSLRLLQAAVERHTRPALWSPGIQTVLEWPAAADSAGLGAIFWLLHRWNRRRRQRKTLIFRR